MKNKILIFFALLSISYTNAQSYFGYLNDNYAGVHSVINNPANIVDSRFRTDINLFTISGFVGNDYYGAKFNDLLKNDFDFENDGSKNPKSVNNFLTNIDVLGPSFMFNLNEKSSIAIFSRGRGILHISNINGKALNDIQDVVSEDYNVPNQNFSVASNSWMEFGVSYARILMNTGTHFLKGGFSAKYLSGLYTGYVKSNNLSINYDFTGNDATNTTTSTGYIESGNINSLDNLDSPIDNLGKGFGGDLGFTYEYRPDYANYQYTNKKGGKSYHKDQNKYKFRIGLSVTDIGKINYRDAIVSKYNANTSYTDLQYNINSSFDVLYAKIEETKSIKFNLPTAIHANADWRMNKRLYLNLNTDLSLISAKNKNSSYINNNVTLTPRYEVKWLSLYTPITYLQYSGLQAGFGFRVGPLFVGSGSILSAMLIETKAVDAHFGLKIPIYQRKLKDIDFDGVYDKYDNCPEFPGPLENKGCPWEDSDKDGVLDKDDKCPEFAGPLENKGCPWEDNDKDGVLDKDDKCPKIFGEMTNEGCPWEDSDKDGVFDKDDKCPEVFGTIANNGCPEEIIKEVPKTEIKQDVIKKINAFSKTILFDTGKTTIKSESFSNLDLIVTLLNEYDTVSFRIEGHTDSAGKPESNLKLSKDRAAAVKKYFVYKGVNQYRLTSEGYGSKKPIASNNTTKGKNLNRRVEINLVN